MVVQNMSVSFSLWELHQAKKKKKNNPNEKYNPSCIEKSNKKCWIRKHAGLDRTGPGFRVQSCCKFHQ